MIAGLEVNENVLKLVIGLFITAWALLKLVTTREYPVPAAGGAIVITGESDARLYSADLQVSFQSSTTD